MKRVGIIINSLDSNWIGGVNYFRNLMAALADNPQSQFKPVVVVGPKFVVKAQELFPGVEVLATGLLDRFGPRHITRKLVHRITARDLLLESYLISKNIKIITHGPALGRRSRIPSLCWIPDFQELHLPQFFTPKEVADRTAHNLRLAKQCTAMIVSSETARQDALRLFKGIPLEVHVLHFVPKLSTPAVVKRDELELKYKFIGPYVYLPNQFWAHKNHRVVLEALAGIAEKNDVQVICTGASSDSRNPGHFEFIQTRLRELKLENRFKILGLIPYADVFSLMWHAHAVINPSLFEGWSTTVEEAKLFNKKLILSDIPVHHEQAGESAIYFNPNEAQACGQAIRQVWSLPHEECGGLFFEKSRARFLSFGNRISQILDIYK